MVTVEIAEEYETAISRPKRILVAEDEHLVATDLAMNLRELGYTVVGPVADGDAAIELAKATLPDLAVLDIRMPKRDGLAAASKIFSELTIPVIILSAHSDDQYIKVAQRVGVFGYLVKPATGGQLRATIDTAWSRFCASADERRINEVLRRKLEDRHIIERAKWILVQRKGLSESDAMHTLQKHARATRRKIVEVSQQLLDANELI